MTVHTACMRVRCCAVKRIIMTTGTVGGSYLHKACMIWRYRRMRGRPWIRMTGTAVAACCKGLANRGAQKRTVCCAMAVGAVFKMRRRSGARQLVLMTAYTVVRTRGRY